METADTQQQLVMWYKLAFIALIFHQFEYSLQCLDMLKNMRYHEKLPKELSALSYYTFLRELESCVENMPSRFPETFSTKYSFLESQKRFEQKPPGSTVLTKFKELFLLDAMLSKKIPFFSTLKFLESSLIGLHKLFRRYSRIEALLLKYGLKNHAHVLLRKRILQSTLRPLYRVKIV
jgi:hypothetical protein